MLPPAHFPFHVVYAPVLWREICGIIGGHGLLPTEFYIHDLYHCIQKYASQARFFARWYSVHQEQLTF